MTTAELPGVAAAAAAAACTHCGLPAPAAGEGEPPFCCGGCRTAYRIIHESGLERFYALPEKRRAAVHASGRGFEEFDHAAFRELYVRVRPDGLAETELYLEGVHCASCVWLVERVPLALPGVARAELDVPRRRVTIVWDDRATPLSRVAAFLDRLGYRPHPFRGVKADAMRRGEDRTMLAHIGVAGALAGNTMLIALALYSGWFSGMEQAHERFFRWVSLALATPALIWPGRVFLRGAFGALRARALHMDVPIALALAAGWARGAVNTVRDAGPIYFDGVAMLVFLLLVGRFLQQLAQRSATDATELLHALVPSTARVVPEDAAAAAESTRPGAGEAVPEHAASGVGSTRPGAGGHAAGLPEAAYETVPIAALLPGACVEVRDGETIPADGLVIAGRSRIDLSLLTGESRPVAAAPGTRAFAGTVNRSARLWIRVEEAGEASRLGQLMREVEAASRERAPVVQLADRMAGVFVAVVLALAAVTAAIWWGRDASAAVDHAIALLIVTCPCALALATPLALAVAIGRAAHAGILVRGGAALERLARRGTFVLDKTGTVTEGRTRLVAWEGPDDVKPLVLALEAHATHPIADGFREAWPGVAAAAVDEVHVVTGAGIEGVMNDRRVRVGTPAFAAGGSGRRPAAPAAGRSTERAPHAANAASPEAALSPVHVSVDGRIVARAAFGDRMRADSPAAVRALRAMGHGVALLSGDDPGVAAAIARALDIEPGAAEGAATPERKLEAVRAAAARGPVFMVGDGINDAAAIAGATVGIGVSGGAEASLAAADVYLTRPGLGALAPLAHGARRTLRVIRRNIAFSLVYNVAGASLAMAGLLHPLVAAILMPASSITVVLASWWSRTFDAETA
jgi:Cu2+-exporting ATPase